MLRLLLGPVGVCIASTWSSSQLTLWPMRSIPTVDIAVRYAPLAKYCSYCSSVKRTISSLTSNLANGYSTRKSQAPHRHAHTQAASDGTLLVDGLALGRARLLPVIERHAIRTCRVMERPPFPVCAHVQPHDTSARAIDHTLAHAPMTDARSVELAPLLELWRHGRGRYQRGHHADRAL